MQRLKQEVKDRICAAALEEFRESGFSNASIRKISDRADISLGNIYRYFLNKEALYLAVIQPFRDAVTKFLEKQYAVMSESCAAVAQEIMEFIYENESESEIVIKGYSQYEAGFIELLVEMTAVKVSRITNEKMSQFGRRPTNPGFYRLVARSCLNAVFEILKEEVSKETKLANLTELMIFYFGQVGRD